MFCLQDRGVCSVIPRENVNVASVSPVTNATGVLKIISILVPRDANSVDASYLAVWTTSRDANPKTEIVFVKKTSRELSVTGE